MADDIVTRGAGKHAQARSLAEQAVRAEAEGDAERARELFAAATRTDATAVADVLQQENAVGAPASPGGADVAGSGEAEAVRPGDAPSRAGITETGSGADSERR